jgi:hypothetical protein
MEVSDQNNDSRLEHEIESVKERFSIVLTRGQKQPAFITFWATRGQPRKSLLVKGSTGKVVKMDWPKSPMSNL